MKKCLFGAVTLLLLSIPGAIHAQGGGSNFQEILYSTKIPLPTMIVEIEFYSPTIVRVVKYPRDTATADAPAASSHASFSVIESHGKAAFTTLRRDGAITLGSSCLSVGLDLKTGRVSYFDPQGAPLFAEKENGTTFTPYDDAGVSAHSVSQTFVLQPGEAIYGLGQHQQGKMNQRDQTLHLEQRNCEIAIPFVQSVRGYGLFWDNYSPTRFEDGAEGMTFSSQVGDRIDYYFMYGGTMDGTIARMRELTGQAPMFPLWTWGYWQSKERYASQDELVGTVRRYREAGIPLDGIVQDWQYWSTDNDYWNRLGFGNPEFPDPKKMMDDIHAMNAHSIISIWPSFGQRSEPFQEFRQKGMLLNFPTFPSDSARVYNAYDPGARDIYWGYVERNLFSTGMDGWWMDATEPEITGHDEAFFDYPTGAGSFRRVRNAYPIVTVEGVYERQRAVTSDKRVFILTRSAFAGQQRAAAVSWSGDVDGDWATLKKQIPAGLNFSASAIPYWNSDIGGFWVRDGRSSAHEDYRELYVRWLQFGTFSPMMRSHGTNTPREIWQFGRPGDWAWNTIEKFIRLRYSLLPYNYSLGWNVSSRAGSIMRMLAMDFGGDAAVHDMGSQYMWGDSFLVVPVTEPFYTSGEKENSVSDFSKTQTTPVYLPKGADWFDFWTGEKLSGGTRLERATPIDLMPLYVKAGSIVPFGPDVQWADRKDWSELEVRVYRGADASFTLYEDEGDNYNYERGIHSTIRFEWDDDKGVLTIGEREGEFPGMLADRTFRVVLAGGDNGDGAGRRSATVAYRGKKLKVKL